ncbi:MAG: hypothetical protein ACTSRP_10020 [Candidatus Helarchaeota archaeon]
MGKKKKRTNFKNIIFLSHHNEFQIFFEYHVFFIFNYAICIGCLAELTGLIFFGIIFILFTKSILLFIENILYYSIICIISPFLNYIVYIYRFIRKTEFPYKILRFTGRFFLTLGLLTCLTGISILKFFFIGPIFLMINALIFLTLRTYSNNYLEHIFFNETRKQEISSKN